VSANVGFRRCAYAVDDVQTENKTFKYRFWDRPPRLHTFDRGLATLEWQLLFSKCKAKRRLSSEDNDIIGQRILTTGRIAWDGFLAVKVNVIPASRSQCSRLQQLRWWRYWFFRCVHRSIDVRSSDSQCFSVGRMTPKIAPSRRRIWTTI